jgi:hypothetical protein
MKTNSLADNTPRQPSIIELVRGILQDLQTLASKELRSAKLEVKEQINKALLSAISLGAGGIILAIGVVLLSFMLVFLLATYTDLALWASLGIVGLAYTIIGGLLLWRGKEKASEIEPYPRDSVQNVKEDVRHIKETITR